MTDEKLAAEPEDGEEDDEGKWQPLHTTLQKGIIPLPNYVLCAPSWEKENTHAYYECIICSCSWTWGQNCDHNLKSWRTCTQSCVVINMISHLSQHRTTKIVLYYQPTLTQGSSPQVPLTTGTMRVQMSLSMIQWLHFTKINPHPNIPASYKINDHIYMCTALSRQSKWCNLRNFAI